MRVDTLSYRFSMNSTIDAIYQTVLEEQLNYFKRKDSTISILKEGTSITCDLLTKTQRIGVETKITVTKMEMNSCFQTCTSSSTGEVIQTYQLNEKNEKVVVAYSEKNTFKKNRYLYGFMMIGLFYKYFFNRGVRQRMEYLENLAKNKNV